MVYRFFMIIPRASHTSALLRIVLFTGLGFASTAHANTLDDAPLIWSPQQETDHVYALKIGVQLALGWQTAIGTDIRSANPASSLFTGIPGISAPTLWSSTQVPALTTGAGFDGGNIDLHFETGTGTGRIGVSRWRKWQMSHWFSARTEHNYSIWSNSGTNKGNNWRVAETLKLSFDNTATAFVIKTSRSTEQSGWNSRFAAEQVVFENIHVTAAITAPPASSATQSLKAHYNQRW